jgi:DNA-directed RNA polymerase specialized sigma subunit
MSYARRYPASDLDDLISDGQVALVMAVDYGAGKQGFTVDRLRNYAARAIRNSFWLGRACRTWGGFKRSESQLLLVRFRKSHLREHGRYPTRDEVDAHLATLVTNPNIEVHRRSMVNTSPRTLRAMIDRTRATSPAVDRQLLDRETIRLAMKSLKGVDRTLFKLALDGESLGEIARELGIARQAVQRRVNGLLWSSRCRADLAEHLDVQPDAAPARNAYGQLRGIQGQPPARLAV